MILQIAFGSFSSQKDYEATATFFKVCQALDGCVDGY